MEALPKEITNEIRDIVTRCYLGELEHNQKHFHCGTAHCVAGWKQVLDGQKEGNGAWEYARREWQLSFSESVGLFDTNASFYRQFALIEALEAGERITNIREFQIEVANGLRVPTLPQKP